MENNENASEKLNMREKLKEGLMPLYAELPVDFPGKPQNMFCVQWGKLYPKNEKKILFVGKAVNDWCDRLPVDIAFSHNEERIFDREDQMIWVTEPDGNGYFYANRSAFWRTVKEISRSFYPQEDWYENVSWSNLYKIAPKGGNNPNATWKKLQIECCCRILSKEIEVLKPKVVIMLTSGWEQDFIYYLNHYTVPNPIETIEWDQYQSTLYVINGTAFIASQHPQGKSEVQHTEAIQILIDKYNLL